MRLALYEPDIPQNAGAILRMAACLGVAADLIEPLGFLMDDKRVRRAGMDYLATAEVARHRSWAAFMSARRRDGEAGRLVLLTTRAPAAYVDFDFSDEDTLMVGRESGGVPQEVAAACDARVRIPMVDGMRSLNVAVAASMVLGEALRQIDAFPKVLAAGA